MVAKSGLGRLYDNYRIIATLVDYLIAVVTLGAFGAIFYLVIKRIVEAL